MANKPLRFHSQAEEEYLAALAWYQQRSLTAAVNFEHSFIQAIERIAESPALWPIYFRDYRKYTLHQFSFSIVYRSDSSEM